MRVPIYQVDAFTDHVFGGNPAAVCPLEEWLDDQRMLAIAAENNLSETAFIVGGDGHYHIRWFTPTIEVDLCGHATLASAYVIADILEPGTEAIAFDSRSGGLGVVRRGAKLELDFPAWELEELPGSDEVGRALGTQPAEVWGSDLHHLAVLPDLSALLGLRPDFDAIAALGRAGLIATAPGPDDVDCALRFFAPQHGIDEDPVTGSAHCTLIPYWAQRLGKSELTSRQVSNRVGNLDCRLAENRVKIAGNCVLYLCGEIFV